MKNPIFLTLIALLAIVGLAPAQLTQDRVKAAVKDVSGSSSLSGLNPLSILSLGVVDAKGNIVLKANTSGGLVFEGVTLNEFETTFTISDPTADRTITFPDSSGTVALNPVAGTWTFEGATADAYETTLAVVDPTADGTIYFADLGVGDADTNVSVVLSTINSGLNYPGAATAVWSGASTVVFEGTTADGFETTVSAVDPTADQTLSIPNFGVNGAFVLSSLTTNTIDAANSIWFASNALVLEGATANAHELTIAPADVTADRTVTFSDASGTVALSTPEDVTAANVITAAENGSVFFLNSATEFESTLPAPAIGLHFTFIVAAAPTGASYTIVTDSSANVIKGVQVTAEDAGGSGDSGTADDTITLVDGQAVAGDRVEVWSDGTSWFAYATTKVLAGATFTQASP